MPISYREINLFYEHWFGNNNLPVKQLMDSDGLLYLYDAFDKKHSVPVLHREYNTIVGLNHILFTLQLKHMTISLSSVTALLWMDSPFLTKIQQYLYLKIHLFQEQ